MKKSTKQLLILLVVLVVCVAALVAVYLYNSAQSAKEADEAEASVIQLTQLEDVAKLTYFNGTDTMSFTYTDGTWTFDDNPEFPLDGSNLDTISAAVVNLTAVREIDATESLEDYGFTDSALSFTAVDSKGTSLELIMGKAIGDYYYAMYPNGDTIYTISASFVPNLEYTLSQMMTLEIIPAANETKLDSVIISGPSGETNQILFEKEMVDKEEMVDVTDDETGETRKELQTVTKSYWYLTAAEYEKEYVGELQVVYGSTPATMTPVDFLGNILVATSSISNNSCVEYHSDAASLEGFGLSTPALTITVNYTDTDDDGNETPGTYTLMIGSLNEDITATNSDGDSFPCYYAIMDGSSTVYTISSEYINPFMDAYNGLSAAN